MTDYQLPLILKEEIAEGTMLFRFSTAGTSFAFRAGQYADFTLIDPTETDAEGNTRSFSLVSSPHAAGYVEITTRMRDTAFKRTLRDMPLGTKVKVSAPMGPFTLHENATRPAIFLTGGIGITPVLSILRHATEKSLSHRLILFYTNRTPASSAFLPELEELAKKNQNFTLLPTITEPTTSAWLYEKGRIDETFLRAHIPQGIIPLAFWYVVGPPAMVSGLLPLLPKIGADPDAIKTEEFAGY